MIKSVLVAMFVSVLSFTIMIGVRTFSQKNAESSVALASESSGEVILSENSDYDFLLGKDSSIIEAESSGNPGIDTSNFKY